MLGRTFWPGIQTFTLRLKILMLQAIDVYVALKNIWKVYSLWLQSWNFSQKLAIWMFMECISKPNFLHKCKDSSNRKSSMFSCYKWVLSITYLYKKRWSSYIEYCIVQKRLELKHSHEINIQFECVVLRIQAVEVTFSYQYELKASWSDAITSHW